MLTSIENVVVSEVEVRSDPAFSGVSGESAYAN